ncbi:serine hydrolase domain-containing protein [Paracoccus albus]|uniref:serine hydrolase domain-containing protein n=1 Tax=Paracoccus albus TaxID=3017784 RepID=UPI0022F06EC9|nr:serine hydrolase domain-containing protein [Paracoccus albus]WBU60156.1 serine hydrolase [Paracoccus albus]
MTRIQPQMTAKMDAAIDSALAERRIVGTVTMLSENGNVTYRRAAGFSDRESAQQMQMEDRFRYASITKLFTTAAALKLIEVGRLDPAAPVTNYLPDFQPRLANGRIPVITIDHLMSHMAGLDYDFQQPVQGPYARACISNGLDNNRATMAENLKRLSGQTLLSEPGGKWRYSMATDVLGGVISAICDEPLPIVVAELVSGPLGLNAGFHRHPDRLVPTYKDSDTQPVRYDEQTEIPFGDGIVLRLDPQRIGRNDRAFASGGGGMEGDAASALVLIEALRDGDFLSPGMRQQAMKLRTPPNQPTRGPGWGFSWLGSYLIDPNAAGTALAAGTIAWGGVYGYSWLMSPQLGRCMVALTNTALEGMIGRFAAEIAEATA